MTCIKIPGGATPNTNPFPEQEYYLFWQPGTGLLATSDGTTWESVSGSGATVLIKSQTDLLDAGGGNWYLPLPEVVDVKNVVGAIYNDISFNGTLDRSVTPARYYGFPNNSLATIQITII